MKRAAQLLTIGLAGAVLASVLHIPAGFMIGSMLAVILFKLIGSDLGQAPCAYGQIGQILLGTFIGATFNRGVLAQLGDLLPAATLATLASIGASMALAWLLARLTHLDVATALFSLTPGGMPEMVAVCEEAGADVAAVAALQFLRYVTVLILVPAAVGWLLF